MLSSVDNTSSVNDFLPYRDRWELTEARRYLTRSPTPLSVSLRTEFVDGIVRWREITFMADPGVQGVATVVSPVSGSVVRGVVLAHGGSDDGRRFFVCEAAGLAARGAAVILPVMRLRLENGCDAFAEDVRKAVLIERAALDVLVDWAGAPPGGLSFLGHSAGGAIGAVLSAVEPRLTRITILGTAPATWRARRGLSNWRTAASSRRSWLPSSIGSTSRPSSSHTAAASTASRPRPEHASSTDAELRTVTRGWS